MSEALVRKSTQDVSIIEAVLDCVPDVEEGSYEQILTGILQAQSAWDLDSPFRNDSLAALRNEEIEVLSVRKAPSEFDGGLGYYLVVDCVVTSSGERVTVTTGSVSIVAQLARAVAINALPLRCIPRVAQKPTKHGYYPQHLEISRQQPQKKQDGHTEYVVTDDLPF